MTSIRLPIQKKKKKKKHEEKGKFAIISGNNNDCASFALDDETLQTCHVWAVQSYITVGGGCITHQLLKSKSIFEYWTANFNAALCHADLLNAVSGVANVLNFFFFFSMMQLGTFGSFTMMYGEENGSNCQRCTSNFSFMAPLFLSLLCKITQNPNKSES